jgi:DNA polymerase IIIc chi subunit
VLPTSLDERVFVRWETLSIKGESSIPYYHKAWRSMTEESENKEPISPEKLLIDNSSNFQFHAAYVAYSDVFDKVTDAEAKKQLNQSILDLQQNQIDYQAFYERIGKFRGEDPNLRGYGRAFIKTQKKREWRRKTQKHERIERHK